MSRTSSNIVARVAGSPLLWGGALTAGFYGLIFGGVITQPLVVRYTTGHPIEFVTIGLFFFALAAQALRAGGLSRERKALRTIDLGEIPNGGQPPRESVDLQRELSTLYRRLSGTYFYRRLWSALENVRRRETAEGLDEELKYLSDRQADERHANGAFVRVIMWAVPMLGFLGTVIGLTTAIANLSVDANQDSINRVLSGLGAAFDTTALALGLVMVMMFVQFLVDRQERLLLDQVDEATTAELAERFQTGGSADPVLHGVQQMAETVQSAVGEMAANVHDSVRAMAEDVQRLSLRLLKEQAELWSRTMQQSHAQWNRLAEGHQQNLAAAMSESLEVQLRRHAESIVEGELRLAAESRSHWSGIQTALESTTQQMLDVQRQLREQSDLARQVLQATGEVTSLEMALNHNLHKLAEAGQFEETLVSLSAAIHLLAARLGSEDTTQSVRIGLRRSDPPTGSTPAPHHRDSATASRDDEAV